MANEVTIGVIFRCTFALNCGCVIEWRDGDPIQPLSCRGAHKPKAPLADFLKRAEAEILAARNPKLPVYEPT